MCGCVYFCLDSCTLPAEPQLMWKLIELPDHKITGCTEVGHTYWITYLCCTICWILESSASCILLEFATAFCAQQLRVWHKAFNKHLNHLSPAFLISPCTYRPPRQLNAWRGQSRWSAWIDGSDHYSNGLSFMQVIRSHASLPQLYERISSGFFWREVEKWSIQFNGQIRQSNPIGIRLNQLLFVGFDSVVIVDSRQRILNRPPHVRLRYDIGLQK